jgi:hypothetical protein
MDMIERGDMAYINKNYCIITIINVKSHNEITETVYQSVTEISKLISILPQTEN